MPVCSASVSGVNVFVCWLTSSGEYQQRLRHLEKSLLDALNDVKGRILDDDSIITHLEKLKKEAADIARKVRGRRA